MSSSKRPPTYMLPTGNPFSGETIGTEPTYFEVDSFNLGKRLESGEQLASISRKSKASLFLEIKCWMVVSPYLFS